MMTGCVLECISRHITWYLTSDDRWSCIQGVLPGTAPICLQEEEKKKSIVHHLSYHDVSARRFNSPLSRILIESILLLRPPTPRPYPINSFVIIKEVVAQWYTVCRLAVRETRQWQVNKYDPIEFATTGGGAHDRSPV